jgi:phosphate transport system protein
MTDAERLRSHTDRQYEAELDRIRDRLARMGGTVEEMIAEAVHSLVAQDRDRARAVIERDHEVNSLEVEVDDLCLRVLARRQPAASDLRFLAATLKLVVDLERIGDLAVNVAERAADLSALPPLKPYIDLPRMGQVAREMVSDGLDSVLRRDTALARTVFGRDNVVDALYAQVLRELLTYMIEDPANIQRANFLLSIAKGLERIGDHATNLAEQAIFLVEGRDVRHTGLGKFHPGELPHPVRGVLFVCVANSARSQMAEAWGRHLAPAGIEVASAGTAPTQVNPLAVQAMAEVGLGMEHARSKSLADVDLSRFDVVVTLCEESACPVLPPGPTHVHWPLPDPAGHGAGPEALTRFREVRDELAARVERLFRIPGRP